MEGEKDRFTNMDNGVVLYPFFDATHIAQDDGFGFCFSRNAKEPGKGKKIARRLLVCERRKR